MATPMTQDDFPKPTPEEQSANAVDLAECVAAYRMLDGNGRFLRPDFCDVPKCREPIVKFRGYTTSFCATHGARAKGELLSARVTKAQDQVPGLQRNLRFTSPEMHKVRRPAAIGEARTALLAGVTMIVLRGATGRGKTILAAACANHVIDSAVAGCSAEALDRAAGVRWFSAIELGVAAREAPLGVTPKPLRDALEASLLVIDELGREADADSLYRVIFERHQRGRQTIVTTWMDGTEITARYGGGGGRRLLEDPRSVISVDPVKP